MPSTPTSKMPALEPLPKFAYDLLHDQQRNMLCQWAQLYGQAAYQAGRDAALEEAAKVCEDIHDDNDFEDDLKAKYCAKAIRNRKGTQP